MWERAIEIFHGPVLDDDRTFIHRDFYPGNVLWHRRTVSGLVDWEAASVGPRSMDVAHCRINLLYDGLDAADIFTRIWEQRTGRTFHRWADIATVIGLLDSDVATRRPNANGATSRRCCSKPSTRSTARSRAQNAYLRAYRTRAAPERTAPRTGDLRALSAAFGGAKAAFGERQGRETRVNTGHSQPARKVGPCRGRRGVGTPVRCHPSETERSGLTSRRRCWGFRRRVRAWSARSRVIARGLDRWGAQCTAPAGHPRTSGLLSSASRSPSEMSAARCLN